ncbi:CDP-glycerol glycerophosphotransferase family protein [Streptomyces microflavus]
MLVRLHPRVTGGVQDGPGVLDVSHHPGAAGLLLIADVLVTDYAGLMFDFALTGRPMLFHTYDLEHYRDTVRGFCLDFETRAPGPLLVTTDEVAQALRSLGALAARHADAYESFRRDYCDLDDGRAAAGSRTGSWRTPLGGPRPSRPPPGARPRKSGGREGRPRARNP